MIPHHLKLVFLVALTSFAAGCGRAPADSGEDGWPPSQGKSEPPPGTDAKTPPGKTPGGGCTVGSMVTVTVIEKLRGERTSTSILVDKGKVHTTYWRCTVPNYQRKAPIPEGLPCSGHRYATGQPDKTMFVAESIHDESGMGTAIWLSAGGLPRASSSGLSEVYVHGRGAGPVWTTAKMPGNFFTSFPRTWAGLDSSGKGHVAWTAAGGKSPRELWHAVQTANGWQAKKHMNAYDDVVAAFDEQGRVHLAHSTGEHGLDGSQILLYLSPKQKPWGVTSSTKQSLSTRALELDKKGNAHLLYTSRKRMAVAQWEPTEVWYATNASGKWKQTQLNKGRGFPAYFTAANMALTVDSVGNPYVALNGTSWSGYKSKPETSTPLVAGAIHGGAWDFYPVDHNVTGALDLAENAGHVYISYFGEADFRVARVMVF